MKALAFLLLLLFVNPPEKDVQSIFQSYAESPKTVALHLQEKANCKNRKENYRLETDKYFRIIPPKYDIRFDTIPCHDPSKLTEEASYLYAIVEEQVLVKEASYKWIKETQEINFCEQERQFKELSKNQWILKYQESEGEYIRVSKLVLRVAPNHNPNRTKEDLEKIVARNKIAIQHAKATRSQQIIKRETVISHGSIEEIQIADIEKLDLKEEELLILRKGQWKVFAAGRVDQKCEATIKNQQICLYRLGYQTSLDGKMTLAYKIARRRFRKDHNLLQASKEEYLRALGW